MTDLKQLAQPILDDPPLPRTSVEMLQRRVNRRRAVRALAAGAVLVLVTVSVTVALIATGTRQRPSIDRPSPNTPATRAFVSPDLAFRYPASWHLRTVPSPVDSQVISVALSPQPLRNPCRSTRFGPECGSAIASLNKDSVVVSWFPVMPHVVAGQPITVGGHQAVATTDARDCRKVRATRSEIVSISPPNARAGGAPPWGIAMQACYRGPNTAANRRAVQRMLSSTTIGPGFGTNGALDLRGRSTVRLSPDASVSFTIATHSKMLDRIAARDGQRAVDEQALGHTPVPAYCAPHEELYGTVHIGSSTYKLDAAANIGSSVPIRVHQYGSDSHNVVVLARAYDTSITGIEIHLTRPTISGTMKPLREGWYIFAASAEQDPPWATIGELIATQTTGRTVTATIPESSRPAAC